MATFLELCQQVAHESGTIEGTRPLTTDGQTGRLGLIVSFVRQAWLDIQNTARWRFLYKELPGNAVLRPGVHTYKPDSLGLGAQDFQAWELVDPQIGTSMSIWDINPRTNTFENPQDDQTDLFAIDYATLKRRFQYGTEAVRRERPRYVAISDAVDELVFAPTPDAVADGGDASLVPQYRLVATYVTAPQIFREEGDDDVEPAGLPVRYHEAIKWKAMRLLAEFDEADALVLQTAQLNLNSYLSAMRRDLLRRGGPYIDTQGGLGLGGSIGGRSFGLGIGAGFGPPPTAGFG